MDPPSSEGNLGSLISEGDSSDRKICNYKLLWASAEGTSKTVNLVIESNRTRRPSARGRYTGGQESQESQYIEKILKDEIKIVLVGEKELQITATSAAHEFLEEYINDYDDRRRESIEEEKRIRFHYIVFGDKDLEMAKNRTEQRQKTDLNAHVKYNHPLVADNNEIKIIVKQFTGKSILISIDANKSIAELLEAAYNKRQPQQEAATVTNYVKAVNLIFSGVELDHSKAIKDYKIKSGSTINEVLKSWTMGSRDDFDWGTLSAESSITSEDISKPFLLNPGCLHTFDKAELREWALKVIKAEGTPSCPHCKSKIDPNLLEILTK
jgi:hypothetical protein